MIRLEDGKWYNDNDLQYRPLSTREPTPFLWSRSTDLTILKDSHGSATPWKTLSDIIRARNVDTIYMELPSHRQSLMNAFMDTDMSIDEFLLLLTTENVCGQQNNPKGSGSCAAMVKALQLAREKKVHLLCIDDWSRTECFSCDLIRRNHLMAQRINGTHISVSVLVVGGLHAEGIFAVQHMIHPKLTVSVMETDRMFYVSPGLVVSFRKHSNHSIDFELCLRDTPMGRGSGFNSDFGKFAIQYLFIEPEHRRHGYGTSLYKGMEKCIMERCFNHANTFEIILSSVKESWPFWRNMGFTFDGPGPIVDEYRFAKKIVSKHNSTLTREPRNGTPILHGSLNRRF